MNYDNPAQRLLKILRSAFEIASTIDKDSNKVNSVIVWSKVFNVSSQSPVDLAQYAEEFVFLLKASRDAVNNLQRITSPDPYLDCLNDISRCIQEIGMLGKWSSFNGRLNNSKVLNALAMTADAVTNENRLVELSEDQLAEMLADTTVLLDKVLHSDIDDELKIFLTVRLQEICNAIEHYSIRGSAGLQHVIEKTLGAAALKAYVLGKEPSTFLQQCVDLVVKFSTLLGLAADVQGFLLPTAAVAAQHMLTGSE